MIVLYLAVVDGVESIEPTLSRARDLASSKGLKVGEEIIETVRSLAVHRPRLQRLCSRIDRGEVSGVVGAQLSDWFRSTPAAALGLLAWLERGLAVYTLDGVASDLAGRAELGAALQWWKQQQQLRASRAIKASIAKRRQIRSTWGRGHARVPITEHELVALTERGLSIREITRALGRRRVVASRETVRLHVRDLARSGRVDPVKRAAAIARRGGLPKGGRPRKVKNAHP